MKIKQTWPLFLLAIIWGGYYVATQKSVEFMSSFTVGIVIRFITMILLTAMLLWKKQLSSLLKVKGAVGRLLLIGLMGFSLDLTAFIGLTLSPAGPGTALLKTDILFVNLISLFIYRQKFTKKEWLFTFVMLGGILLVMNLDFVNMEYGTGGEIFFILSALFVSINAFIIKSVQRDEKVEVSNDVIAFYNNFVTMILFTITALALGTFNQITMFGTNMFVTVALLLAGLGQTLVYVVYYYDLARFPVWLVKVILLFMPIVSSILGFILFDDRLVPIQMIGIAVVIVGATGVLLEQRGKSMDSVTKAM